MQRNTVILSYSASLFVFYTVQKIYPNFLFLLIDEGNVLGRKRSGLTCSQFFKRDLCRTNKSRKQKKIILNREIIFTQIGKLEKCFMQLCAFVATIVYIITLWNFHFKHCSFDVVSLLKIKNKGKLWWDFWNIDCIILFHFSFSHPGQVQSKASD